jgi:hypothetical protein
LNLRIAAAVSMITGGKKFKLLIAFKVETRSVLLTFQLFHSKFKKTTSKQKM